MARVGHSTLLKYFVDIENLKMSENKTDPATIESQVPQEQVLRDAKEIPEDVRENGDPAKTADDETAVASKDDFVYSPVITVTKEETTFSKGDVKLQKVVVSEDISDLTTNANTTLSVTEARSDDLFTETRHHASLVPTAIDSHKDINNSEKSEVEDQKHPKRTTKIPKLKQVIQKIKKEQMIRNEKDSELTLEPKGRSAIPRLKDFRNAPQSTVVHNKKDVEKVQNPKTDDEFDKIYEGIVEDEGSSSMPSLERITNATKLESKFEEIIHAYDENKDTSIEPVKSKIPLLKRQSEEDMEIPLQINRKNSIKKYRTDDTKCKIPVAITKEKTFKSENATAKHENDTETQAHHNISSNIKSEAVSNKRFESFGCVGTISTQKRNDVIELVNTSPTGSNNIVQSKNGDSSVIEQTLKINEPAAVYSKESQTNSITLNKHPTDINMVRKTSISLEPAEKATKDNKTEDGAVLSVELSPDSLLTPVEKNISYTLKTGNTDNKIITEQETRLSQQSLRQTLLSSKSFQVENNVEHIHRVHSKRQVYDLPVLPTNLRKFEKSLSNSSIKETVSSQPDCKISNIAESVPLPEIIHTFNVTQYKDGTLQSYCVNDDIRSVSNMNTVESSHFMNRSISSDICSEKITNTLYPARNNNEDHETNDLTIINPKIAASNIEQGSSDNDNVVDDDKFQLKENNNLITVDTAHKSGTTSISEVVSLKPSTISITNENSTVVAADQNVTSNTKFNSNISKIDLINQEQTVDNNIKQSLETQDLSEVMVVNKNGTEDNDTKLENVNSHEEISKPKEITPDHHKKLEDREEEEEDIIVLRGKVNRVIRRLDSKDFIPAKKEIDDVPREVCVMSKIAIFERTDPADTVPNRKKSNLDVRSPNSNVAVVEKPKIVNEILKTPSKIVYNPEENKETEVSEEVFVSTTVQVQNRANNDNSTLSTNEFEVQSNDPEKVSCLKTKVLSAENKDVHIQRDYDPSSLEIWNEYRRRKEIAVGRAKSLAELDLGDAVKGKVKQMVVRMNSIDGLGLTRREVMDLKEKPKVGSVLQRIALYERKLTPIRGEESGARRISKVTQPDTNSHLSEEEILTRIEELSNAKAKFGVHGTRSVELADGSQMPTLAFGTALLEPKLIKHLVSAAIELGYRAFDTAYIYGNEREVGLAIAEKIRDGTVTREELFIINKLWSTFHGRELAERACRQSLEAMGLEYFDLYLIHNPMSFKEGPNPLPKIANVLQYSEHDYLDAWFGIENLIRKGLVRRGGVSNFNSMQLERVIDKGKIKPVVNQVECHPYLNQLRLEEFCLARNVKLSCFGVLGSPGTPAYLTSGAPSAIADPLVKVMAAGLGVSPATLLISYQVQRGRSVVVKCSSAAHLATSLLVVPLDHSHLAALDALNRNKRTYTFTGMGDTHRNYPFKIPF